MATSGWRTIRDMILFVSRLALKHLLPMLNGRCKARLTIGWIHILAFLLWSFRPLGVTFFFSVDSIFGAIRCAALYPSYLCLFVLYGADLIAGSTKRVGSSDLWWEILRRIQRTDIGQIGQGPYVCWVHSAVYELVERRDSGLELAVLWSVFLILATVMGSRLFMIRHFHFTISCPLELQHHFAASSSTRYLLRLTHSERRTFSCLFLGRWSVRWEEGLASQEYPGKLYINIYVQRLVLSSNMYLKFFSIHPKQACSDFGAWNSWSRTLLAWS